MLIFTDPSPSRVCVGNDRPTCSHRLGLEVPRPFTVLNTSVAVLSVGRAASVIAIEHDVLTVFSLKVISVAEQQTGATWLVIVSQLRWQAKLSTFTVDISTCTD